MKKYNKSQSYDPEVLEKIHNVHRQIMKDFTEVCEKYGLSCFAVYGTAIGAVRHGGFIPWDDDVDMAMLREDYDKFFKVFPKELKEKYNLLTPERDERYACTVTHLQRRGTVFISEMSQDLKCEHGIYMDIFPLDYVAEGRIRQMLQGLTANFWGKILFLAGSSKPVITYRGIVGEAMSLICRCVHHLIRIFRISPRWFYRRYMKTATKYNHSRKRSEYVTSFEYMGCLKDKIKRKEIFPLKKVPFEDMEVNLPHNNHEFLSKVYGNYMKLPPKDERVNHMPLVIQFEGEKPIYKKTGI